MISALNLIGFLIFLLCIILAVIISINLKGRKNKLTNEYSEIDKAETVFVSPMRPLGLSFALAIMGLVFLPLGCALFLSSSLFDFDWFVGFLIAALGVAMLFFAAKAFITRNHIVQFQMTKKGLYYRPIKWAPRRFERSGFSIIFGTKLAFIEYTQIQFVDIVENWRFGDTIRIFPKNGESFYLPFLYENKEQVNEIYVKLNNYLQK